MNGIIVVGEDPSNQQFPEYNISTEFNFPVYIPESEEHISSDLDIREIDVPLPPLIGRVLEDNFTRIQFSFWKPPAKYEYVISFGLPTQSLVCWPEQHRIHYFHGIHRGSFGFPERDSRSNNSIIELLQLINRIILRISNSASFDTIDTVVANSTFTKKNINRLYNINVDEVIPPSFVEIDKYQGQANQRGDYYLYLGRLADAKGVNKIIEAFNRLKIPLRVAGEGPLKSELIQKSNQNIQILGYISESKKRELLSNCKGLVHNTIAEPFGVVLVEALASGSPVVSVNAGNPPNLVEEGETGVLFNRQTGGTTYQRPQSADPVIGAVQKAESIDWDHEYIKSTAVEYSKESITQQWHELFERI